MNYLELQIQLQPVIPNGRQLYVHIRDWLGPHLVWTGMREKIRICRGEPSVRGWFRGNRLIKAEDL